MSIYLIEALYTLNSPPVVSFKALDPMWIKLHIKVSAARTSSP